jgi:hypothetical protein
MAMLLTDSGEFAVNVIDGTWLAAADVARATGFSLKPEGLCRGDLCVPLPKDTVRDGRIDIAAFWRRLDAPIVADTSGEVLSLGTGAEDHNAPRHRRQAPHALSAARQEGVPQYLGLLVRLQIGLARVAATLRQPQQQQLHDRRRGRRQ